MTPTLHLLCGKIASGKSTLAAALGRDEGTVVISEDDWLAALFGSDMKTGADYLRCSGRLQRAMAPHATLLLQTGVSVVLDFAANTADQRAWMRNVIDASGAAHQLHILGTPDAVCLDRLRKRNARGSHAFKVSDAQFHRFSAHFEPPGEDEGFTIVRHGQDEQET